ncbi:MAG: hypothetical protein Q9225_003702 [Loekoesia sp. 1 TL-2023]
MASQWPQNYQNPQGYGYSQYSQPYPQQPPHQYTQQPQQYAQQQAQQYPTPHAQPNYPHYPQQPTQQQYPPQQGPQYANQYSTAANTAYAPANQSQSNQQGCYNCGAPGHWAQDCPEPRREVPAGASNRPPPFKRHKPNPPVVTKYAVPPHPYMPTAPPTPVTPYGPQYGSQASPQASQANPANFSQNSQQHQHARPPSQSMTTASPVSAVSQPVPYQPPQRPASTAVETANTHQGSRSSSVSMHSMSITPKQQSVEAPEEDDDSDDLRKLDVPDIPMITGKVHHLLTNDAKTLVKDDSFASLVDRPLPANFIVADALEPFDPPQPENNGRCQSKYVILDASKTFTGSIKDTKHWEDLKNDPIFSFVQDSSRTISLDEIMLLYHPRPVNEEQEQEEIEEGEWTQHTIVQHEEDRDVMDRLEHSLSARQPVKAPTTVPRTTSWDHTPRRDSFAYGRAGRSSEEAAAPFGMDGIHRPHHNTAPPFPPPPAKPESPASSPEHTPPMRTRTPSMYELDELYKQEYGVRPGSTIISGGTASEPTANGRQDRDGHSSLATLDPFEPPPPPAHLQKPASYDGTCEDPLSAGSPNGHPHGNGFFDPHHRNGSDAANGRKRDHDQQVVSDEDHTPKRRQVDDTKSKLKKRQPKVAAAYSRRW